MKDFFALNLNFWGLLIPIVISSAFVLFVTFLSDRGYYIFHKNENRDKIRNQSPQIKVMELYSNTAKLAPAEAPAYYFHVEKQGKGNPEARFEDLRNSPSPITTGQLKMLQILNNTDFGCTIERMWLETGWKIAIGDWTGCFLEPQSSVTLYMDFMHCPQRIDLVYKGYRLSYPSLNLPPFDYRIPASIREIKYE